MLMCMNLKRQAFTWLKWHRHLENCIMQTRTLQDHKNLSPRQTYCPHFINRFVQMIAHWLTYYIHHTN
jgi:hypothetical protein